MTSNVGTASINDRNVGFRDLSVGEREDEYVYKEMTRRVTDAYSKMFRPEFRNRIDEHRLP
jgi:ATP-dependent Clp protease ATP-binding subunit ClpA